ncbi:hypothetical protein RUND412_002996 [Rhizina undulata]
MVDIGLLFLYLVAQKWLPFLPSFDDLSLFAYFTYRRWIRKHQQGNSDISIKPGAQILETKPREIESKDQNESKTYVEVSTNASTWQSRFPVRVHKRYVNEPELNKRFLDVVTFPNERKREMFIRTRFQMTMYLAIPNAIPERIDGCVTFVSVFFILDDVLDRKSREEVAKLSRIIHDIAAGVTKPAETPNDRLLMILWDICNEMRAIDPVLAPPIFEPIHDFLFSASVDKVSQFEHLDEYLLFRQYDVGYWFLAAMVRYGIGLNVSREELESIKDIDMTCSNHFSLVNDYYSWNKEVKQVERRDTTDALGALGLVNAVAVTMKHYNVEMEEAKGKVLTRIREYENTFCELVEARMNAPGGASKDLEAYMDNLRFLMSGNEYWCQITGRYCTI